MYPKAPCTLLIIGSLFLLAGCSGGNAAQTEKASTLPPYQADALVIQEIFRGDQRFRLTGVYGSHRNDQTLSWVILVPENLLNEPEEPNLFNVIEDGDAVQPTDIGLDISNALSITIHAAHGIISVNNERMQVEPGFSGLILGSDSMVPLDVPPALLIAWLQYYNLMLRFQNSSFEAEPGPLWNNVLGPLVSRGIGNR